MDTYIIIYLIFVNLLGFAMMFSQMLGLEDELRSSHTAHDAKRALVVCGSLNSMSVKQVAYAESMGMQSMLIPEGQKCDPDYFLSAKGSVEFAEMQRQLDQNKVLILKAMPDDGALVDEILAQGSSMDNRQVAKNMGAMVVELIRSSEVDYLVVFGGDTLYGILSQMDGILITLEKEFEPGIVCSMINFQNKGLHLITKAGGFGDSLTLTNILRYIGRQK